MIPERSTIPMHSARIYPAISPKSTDNERINPFAQTWNKRHMSRVTLPTIQLFVLPKSAAPCPPAKEFAPIGRSENPIAVTTDAATTCGMSFIQYFANRPSVPSINPPIITAPISVPIPCVLAIPMLTERNVNEIPITIGRREPMRQIG